MLHSSTHIPSSVTICITSCGRLDLLAQTMESFTQYHTGGTYLISEDSTDTAIIQQVKDTYPYMRVLSGETRLGVMGSIDRLYAQVETPYIFHLEDDWEFDGPIDWENAIALFEAQPEIANICVRAFEEIKPKHRKHSDITALNESQFAVMRPEAHPEFYGWSPNPGLFRTQTYQRYAPFNRVLPDQMSAIIKRDGGRQAYLLPGVARHIGHGRHVPDPGIPPRPKNKIAKIIRAWKKKFYYAGLRKEPY